MEIQGAAFVGEDPLLSARAERLVARAAARAALPFGIVRLDHRPRSAVAAFEAGLGTPVRDADALRALARGTVAAGRPTFLLDDLRWRAWAALSTGAAFILCPDASPDNAPALATMGFTVIELPERSLTDSDGDRELWEFLEQPLREAGLDAVGGGNGGNGCDDTEELDRRILLQGYAGRASEIIAERFVQGLHHTAAVIVDAQGNCWPGLGVEGPHSSAACAHAAALSAALLGGARELVYTVGVRHPRASGGTGEYSLVPPCASCGESLLDAAPDLRSIVRVGGTVGSASVAALMVDTTRHDMS